MVLIEDSLGFSDIEAVLGLYTPRVRNEPVEVGADYHGLRHHWRHPLEPVDFFLGLFVDVRRHAQLLDLRPEIGDLLSALVLVAEFVLNRL